MAITQFSENLNDFSIRVDEHVAKAHHGESYLSSGLSFIPLLVNLALGDSGATHQEIFNVLHLPLNKNDEVEYGVSNKFETLLHTPFFKINSTNAIISTHDNNFTESFMRISSKSFHTTPVHIIRGDPEHVSAVMGKIISVQVSDVAIKPMGDGTLHTANTLDLAGQFKERFNPQNTEKRVFLTRDGNHILLETMATKSIFKYVYSEDLDAEIVEIVYEGDEVVMYIIHPKGNHIESVQKKIRKDGVLREQLDKLAPASLDFTLPKFSIWSKTETSPLFSELGLYSMIKHGFNNIVENATIALGYGVQTMRFMIDEDGIEYPKKYGSDEELLKVHVTNPFIFKLFKHDMELLSGVYSPKKP